MPQSFIRKGIVAFIYHENKTQLVSLRRAEFCIGRI